MLEPETLNVGNCICAMTAFFCDFSQRHISLNAAGDFTLIDRIALALSINLLVVPFP